MTQADEAAEKRLSKVLAEVLAGRLDHKLKDLAEALGERLSADSVDGRWICHLPDGESFTVKDLTYRSKRLFEKATKRNINAMDLSMSATDEANLVASYWAVQDPERDGCFTRAMDRVDELHDDDVTFDIDIEVSDGPLAD